MAASLSAAALSLLVSTPSNAGACGMRSKKPALPMSAPAHPSSVLMIEVWSNGYLLPAGARKTVYGAMYGDMRIVGTRTPKRSKLNPLSLTKPSGLIAPHCGAT